MSTEDNNSPITLSGLPIDTIKPVECSYSECSRSRSAVELVRGSTSSYVDSIPHPAKIFVTKFQSLECLDGREQIDT